MKGGPIQVAGGLEVFRRKEVISMEKVLVVLVVTFIMLGFSAVGLSYDRHMAGTAGTSHQAMVGSELKCGPGEIYTGEVSWVDPDIHRMMVTGRDGSKIFDLSKTSMKGFPEANEFVTVNYTVVNGDRIASSVVTVSKRVASLYVGAY